jgi:hypothetical protein
MSEADEIWKETMTWPNKIAVESAIGAGRSAVAVPAASRRRLFLR